MQPLVLILVVFVLGAYYSGMETVFTSFDRILVMGWKRSRKFGAGAVEFLSARPDRFLGTTLIGNNLINVVYSSLLVLLAEDWKLNSAWLVTVSPIIVLIFSEILPKMVGLSLANRLIRWWSWPLLVSYYLFWPFRMLMMPVTRLLVKKSEPDEEAVSGETLALRRELDQILVGAEEEGAVTAEEGELLERFLDARDLKVRQIMTPRTELVAASVDATPEEVRELFRRWRYNVLPVYRGDLDHIIGYVRAFDFLEAHETLTEVIRPIHAVPESKRIVDLLEVFKRDKQRVVLVIDEYGGTDGIVTLKDIFEELVGPVAERFDADRPVIKKISAARYLVSGSAFLDDLEKATGWRPPECESITMSGLLSDTLGRIPDVGEEVDYEGVIVRVIRRSPRRVEGCLLKLPVRPDASEE